MERKRAKVREYRIAKVERIKIINCCGKSSPYKHYESDQNDEVE